MPRKVDPQAIEAEVAALGGLYLSALRERWQNLGMVARPAEAALAHPGH